jgi:hypothetical protein
VSLPIGSAMVVRQATHLADEVARRIGEAVGFAEVLEPSRASDPASGDWSSEGETAEAGDSRRLGEQLSHSIEQWLRLAGFSMNQPLKLRVHSNGSMQVSHPPEQATEIEARLRGNPELRELARQWVANQPEDPAGIDLTIPVPTATILPVPGGYPNW